MASSHTAAQVRDGCTGQLTGRGTLGAGQLTALILGQNSGGHSQALLGLLASLNQPRHPLCMRCGTLRREGAAATSAKGVCFMATQIRTQSLSLKAPGSQGEQLRRQPHHHHHSFLQLHSPTLLSSELKGAG